MNKFTRGMSYIFNGKLNKKYIIHQTGLKSWRAVMFTHTSGHDSDWEFNVLEGNATTLFEKLVQVTNSYDGKFEVRAYNTDMGLRKDMFNILKFGRFEE